MKYLLTYLSATVVFIAFTACFNWWVDPFGMYWSPRVTGINEEKPEAGKRSRITKVYRASQLKPYVLLVGNSRVEMGLDPQHPAFSNQPVYNQGMPGAGVAQQTDYALNVIAGSPGLHTLIIGVDFLDFLINADPTKRKKVSLIEQPDYWPRLSALAEGSLGDEVFRVKEKASMLLSLDAFSASFRTILSQNSMMSSINLYGFNTAQTYLDIIRHEGIEPLYTQKLQELERRLKNKNLTTGNLKGELTKPFLHLQKLLDSASERELNVYLFISPYHYSYLQLLDELNYRSDFIQWKSQLTTLVERYSPQQIQLWDFSSLNKYTLEHVPLGLPKQQMQWYWEPAHYKKELGDLILERMLGSSDQIDFGRRLRKSNITSVIQQDHSAIDNSKNMWRELKAALTKPRGN